MAAKKRQINGNKKDTRNSAAAADPTIVVIGASERARSVQATLDEMNAVIAPIPSLEERDAATTQDAVAFVVVAPVAPSGTTVADVVRELRRDDTLATRPIVAVVPNNTSDQAVKIIYAAAVSAVFKWPSESKTMPLLLAEIIGMNQARGKASSADRALTRTIRAHIKTRNFQSGNLKIDVTGGVATVSGALRAYRQLRNLKTLVEQVPGITQTRFDGLYVAPSGIPDRQIRSAAKQVLKATTDIDPATIAIKVTNGTITLAGTLKDKREHRRVVDLLSEVKGVRGIDEYAVISETRKREDKALMAELQNTLAFAHPSDRITVAVFGGTAVLTGRVKNLRDRRGIVETVAVHEGVRRVVNKIVVSK